MPRKSDWNLYKNNVQFGVCYGLSDAFKRIEQEASVTRLENWDLRSDEISVTHDHNDYKAVRQH